VQKSSAKGATCRYPLHVTILSQLKTSEAGKLLSSGVKLQAVQSVELAGMGAGTCTMHLYPDCLPALALPWLADSAGMVCRSSGRYLDLVWRVVFLVCGQCLGILTGGDLGRSGCAGVHGLNNNTKWIVSVVHHAHGVVLKLAQVAFTPTNT
jgi:hypothetical protein